MRISTELKQIRAELNMTQEEFANFLKVNRTLIAGLETGKSVQISFLEILRKKLDISVDRLIDKS